MSAEEISAHLNDNRFEQLVLETAGAPQTVSLAIDIAGRGQKSRWWVRCTMT
jgi:galactitol-1-phosphate 5-dehydrogenase